MSDQIYRQAAIDEMNSLEKFSLIDSNGYLHGVGVRLKFVEQKLEQLPSAQQWTPCSERLPDIKEHHVSEPRIVYCENGAYGFSILEENIFGQVGWNCERDDEYHEPLGDVIAWMPLPKPYKAERREE